jgi:L,D-transpeptidase ErfK/SrfK
MLPMMRGVLLVALWLTTATASAAEYWLVGQDEVIGEVRVIAARYEDTFVSLARTHNVGFEALRRANPDVDPWLPGEGTKIVLPTRLVLPRAPHKGIVVNVAELRLYYFPANSGPPPEGIEPQAIRVVTHPISVGRQDWSTPLGTTTVTGKVANPPWTPPQSIRDEHAARNDILPRVVPAGPDNPLGKHALRLGLPSYLIHGTNKPSGVGMRVTHGCIRMFPEDIESLFQTVPVGTPVRIVNQPHKLGWTAEGLYLEAHPPLLEATVEQDEPTPEAVLQEVALTAAAQEQESLLTSLTRVYVAATEDRRADVQWDVAEQVMYDARGIPELVSVAPAVPAGESFAAEPTTAAAN